VLIKDQAWNECDAVKNDQGRIFFIGLIGFGICFFFFDINRFIYDSGWFTNFSPLNLNGLSEKQLRRLGAEPVVESIGGEDIIQVIKWRLDNPVHHPYISQMFLYMANNAPIFYNNL